MLVVNGFSSIPTISDNKNVNYSRQVIFPSKTDTVSFTSNAKVVGKVNELANKYINSPEYKNVLGKNFTKVLKSIEEFLNNYGVSIELRKIDYQEIPIHIGAGINDKGIVKNSYFAVPINTKIKDPNPIAKYFVPPYPNSQYLWGTTSGEAIINTVENLNRVGKCRCFGADPLKGVELPSELVNQIEKISKAINEFRSEYTNIDFKHEDYNAKAQDFQKVLEKLLPVTESFKKSHARKAA